jgi:hypothetical protein
LWPDGQPFRRDLLATRLADAVLAFGLSSLCFFDLLRLVFDDAPDGEVHLALHRLVGDIGGVLIDGAEFAARFALVAGERGAVDELAQLGGLLRLLRECR